MYGALSIIQACAVNNNKLELPTRPATMRAAYGTACRECKKKKVGGRFCISCDILIMLTSGSAETVYTFPCTWLSNLSNISPNEGPRGPLDRDNTFQNWRAPTADVRIHPNTLTIWALEITMVVSKS